MNMLTNNACCAWCYEPLPVLRYRRATGSQLFCCKEHLRDWESKKNIDHTFVEKRNVKNWKQA